MMKMFFTFMLASALTLSTVLGRSSGPTSRQLMYETDDQTIMESDEVAQVMAVGDRSSNLKYVMAIQSSTIWEEIKKRSLTINTSQGLDDKVGEKSPDNLTDQELAQLKQVCHDGLKCVAVDQLLVLQQVNEPLGDGIVSVRTAITKITQVITKYTTEYHEDVYQYEAVKQSDDQSKVYESVTTIVEDNKELCQIDLTPATVESQPKRGDSNTVPAAVDNNSTVNYNTIKNYNINNGTINSATINKEPSDIITVVESPEPGTQANAGSDPSLVIVIAPQPELANGNGHTEKRSVDDHPPTSTTGTDTDDLIGGESVTKAPENYIRQNRARQNHARDSGFSDPHYEPGTITDDHPKYTRSANNKRAPAGQKLMVTDGPSPHNGVSTDNISAAEVGNDNGVRGKNGAENGQSDYDHDIVSAGSFNHDDVRKGYVEDGSLNNGFMMQYNVNNGTINKGKISGSNADNGIISVGTVNNGPVNYGTSDTYANNGKQVAMDSYDVQQYLSNIDNMYSTILERLR